MWLIFYGHVHAIDMCLDCIPWFLAPTRFVADVLRNVCVHDEFYNDAPSALWHSNCCPRLDRCSLHHVDNACHVDNKHLRTRLWYLWTVTCLLPWNAAHYCSSLLNLLFADYEMGECVSLHDVKANRIFLLPFFFLPAGYRYCARRRRFIRSLVLQCAVLVLWMLQQWMSDERLPYIIVIVIRSVLCIVPMWCIKVFF